MRNSLNDSADRVCCHVMDKPPSPTDLRGWIHDHAVDRQAFLLEHFSPALRENCHAVEACAGNERIGLLLATSRGALLTIEFISVLPIWRRQGVAASLVNALVVHVKREPRSICKVQVSFAEVEGQRHSLRHALEQADFAKPTPIQWIFDIQLDLLATLRWVKPCRSSDGWRVIPMFRYEKALSLASQYIEPLRKWCPPELEPALFSTVYDRRSSQVLIDSSGRIAGWILAVSIQPRVQAIASLFVHPGVTRRGAIGWLISACLTESVRFGARMATFLTTSQHPAMLRVATRHLTPSVWQRRTVLQAVLDL